MKICKTKLQIKNYSFAAAFSAFHLSMASFTTVSHSALPSAYANRFTPKESFQAWLGVVVVTHETVVVAEFATSAFASFTRGLASSAAELSNPSNGATP